MQITKIKFGVTTQVDCGIMNDKGGFDQYSVKSEDTISPDFYKARLNMNDRVASFLNTNLECEVESIDFSLDKNGKEFAVINAFINVGHSFEPAKVKLPKKQLYKGEEEQPETASSFSTFMTLCLEQMKAQAAKFLMGERAQGELFEGKSFLETVVNEAAKQLEDEYPDVKISAGRNVKMEVAGG